MRRLILLVAFALCAGGTVRPLVAQAKNPPPIVRDSDRDGVPDLRDRCRGTPAGTRVDATGCPAPAAPTQAAAPVQAPPPAAAAAPLAAGQPAAPAAAPVQTQAARPSDTAATRGARAPDTAATRGVRPSDTAATRGAQVTQPPAGQPKTGTAPSGLPTLPGAAAAVPAARPGAVLPGAPTQGQAAQPQLPPVAVPAVPAAAQPGAAAPGQPAAGAAPPALAQPAAAAPPPAAAALSDPLLSAGFAVEPFVGEGEEAALSYAQSLVTKFDTLALRLRDVFVNASGAPVAGATAPNFLSSRERNRWSQCRRFHFDLATYLAAAQDLRERIQGSAALERAAASFDDALQGITATSECDNVVSMIEAPDRFAPWEQSYQASGRSFYQNWYGQLRAAHEAARAFGRTLAALGQPLGMIPALPSTPPHPIVR